MHKQSQQSNPSTDWSQVMFAASCSNEPCQDVLVVTARSEFNKLARDVATRTLVSVGFPADDNTIDRLTQAVIHSGKLSVQEHVTVDAFGITACVDSLTVGDEAAYRALEIVALALDRMHGDYGTVYFGPKLTYCTTSPQLH